MLSIAHSPGAWRKSTYSGPSDGCVEVAPLARLDIGVRDSKDAAASPVLRFKAREWKAFLGTVKSGRLDSAERLSG